MSSDVSDHRVPAYVPRTQDPALRARLDRALAGTVGSWQDRLVIASGPLRSGKSRSLAEAVRRCDDERRTTTVVVVHPARGDHLEEIIGVVSVLLDEPAVGAALGRPRVVVLIDDPLYLIACGVNLAFELRRILDRADGRGLAVALTVPEGWLAMSRDTARVRGVRFEDVALLGDHAVRYDPTLDTEETITALAAFGTQIAAGRLTFDDLPRLTRRLASVRDLDAQLDALLGAKVSGWRSALVHALFDAAVVEPAGVSGDWLRRTASQWLAHTDHAAGGSDAETFEDAWGWAAIATPGRGPLVERGPVGTRDGIARWQLNRSIGPRHVASHRPQHWLVDELNAYQLWRLAWHYRHQGRPHAAIECLECLVAGGHDAPALLPSTLLTLGDVHVDLRDHAAARRWFETAADEGHLDSRARLALLDARQSRIEDAT